MATELEESIASLRDKRAAQTGQEARDTDREIAKLVRTWRATGGRLKSVE